MFAPSFLLLRILSLRVAKLRVDQLCIRVYLTDVGFRDTSTFRPTTSACSWSCHSRQSTKLGQYLAQSTWTFRFDLSLKTDGQTNTWHSGKDTILTVCYGQTNTCHSSGQIEIGATGKKDDKCFLVLNT